MLLNVFDRRDVSRLDEVCFNRFTRVGKFEHFAYEDE